MSCKSVLKFGNDALLNNVKITVLMPIFNHNKFLLESITSALCQDCTVSYAILIVDNDANDEYHNLDIIKKLESDKIVYYRNTENLGMVGNWNQCLLLSKSKYGVFLHDDDRLKTNSLKYLSSLSEKYSDFAIIGNTDFIDNKSEIIKKCGSKLSPYTITSSDMVINNACSNGVGSLFRLDYLRQLGGFVEDDYPCLDYALFARYVVAYGAVRTRVSTADIRLAENATLSCYPEMADSNRKVRYSLINSIKLPHWFLKFFIGLSYIQEQEYLYATYSELPCPCKNTKAKRMMYRCCLKVLRLHKRFQLLSYAKKNRS